VGVTFQAGDKIQIEVVSFGPLGASVEVIGLGHDGELLPPGSEPYGLGLVVQKEIAYFRESRNNVDVVRGEILHAYVQNVREEDGKLDVSLRSYGGKAKSDEVGSMILDRLECAPAGKLDIGEKSPPAEIRKEFPGVSKSVFKKALGALYKKGLVKPGPDQIELMKKK
jgi:predicted RNA-binding protein (virulence factor B family)